MLFPMSGPSSLPVVWPSLTKDMLKEQFLFWSGMTDTEEHNATSGSNKEERFESVMDNFCCECCFDFVNIGQILHSVANGSLPFQYLRK